MASNKGASGSTEVSRNALCISGNRIINLPAGEVKPLIDYFKSGLIDLGTQFGFKTEITAAEPDFIVTFIK